MIEQEDLLRFDRFQQLVTWLNINLIRKGRRFLDTNKILLHAEADREIERLIKARVEEILENMQKMQHHRILLRDVRRRGGTPTAIQEAYVNMYGGIAALDLPPWLETIERRRLFLNQLRRPERTTRAQIKLLSDALFRATHDVNVAPEILAELQCELGDILVHSPHSHTFVDHLETLRRAITCYNEALSIYTLERYPWQYAKVYLCLGEVYLQYALATGEAGMIERAIDCYKTAALVFHCPDEFPEQWAVLHTSLGNAYAQRRRGDHEENITKAITCHQSASQSVSLTTFPILWAKIHINLGDLYQQNTIGERLTNLKKARTYYEAALQVYSRADFPKEWADLQARLAIIFQSIAQEDTKKQDLYQGCALVCYECTLGVYTEDAFPVEYAATLVSLANLYRNRTGGERSANLAQALQCYRDALPVFTRRQFPFQHSQVCHDIAETETLRSKEAL